MINEVNQPPKAFTLVGSATPRRTILVRA